MPLVSNPLKLGIQPLSSSLDASLCDAGISMQMADMAHRKSLQNSKKVIRVKLGQSCVSIRVRDNTKMIEKLKGES